MFAQPPNRLWHTDEAGNASQSVHPTRRSLSLRLAMFDRQRSRCLSIPVLTTILIGIAVKAGSTVAESLWREVIWPQLRRRLGTRVLGDRQDGLARSA